MSSDAALPLQREMIMQLQNNDVLQDQMGGSFVIMDKNKELHSYPVILLGETRAFAWQSATFDGQEHEVQLTVLNNIGGSDKAKSISSAIIGVLHNADFPVNGHALVDMQFEKSETKYLEDCKCFQSVIYFKALTVCD